MLNVYQRDISDNESIHLDLNEMGFLFVYLTNIQLTLFQGTVLYTLQLLKDLPCKNVMK